MNSVADVLTKTVNMDDRKIEKLMDWLLLKNNEILDEKLTELVKNWALKNEWMNEIPNFTTLNYMTKIYKSTAL